MVIGPLTFLAPLALFGLLVLPLIWWVLRITPPKPKDQIFPPLGLLTTLKVEEETPNSTPPWLLLYRLFLGALFAVALANPILFKPQETSSRPLVLVIDDGWASAGNWGEIQAEAAALAKQAVSQNQTIAVVSTTNPNHTVGFVAASMGLKQIRSLVPNPYPPTRNKLAQKLASLDTEDADVFWLSDGIDYGNLDTFTQALNKSASQKIFLPNSEQSPLMAGSIEESANGFRSGWHRVDTKSLRTHSVAAYGPQGRVLGRTSLRFGIGDAQAEAVFELPAELRNQVAQLRAEGIASSGAVTLLDDNWGRPLIGLLKGSDENTQPLLSEWHYIENALSPNADIYKGDLDQLLAVSPAIIFMSDRARTQSKNLVDYVEQGGMLVRFSGPKLAKRNDELLPVLLRSGGRDIGGALAWEDPQKIAPFDKDSPFFGLNVSEEIVVQKQIMARPGSETDARTWARLEDGSPIITSAPRGLGRVVMFHVTAGPDWSSLPLSGLYVQMLKRILPLARASNALTDLGQNSAGDWTAKRTLNGYGQLGTPPITIRPIPNAEFAESSVSVEHPPGIYTQGLRRQALNTIRDPNAYKLLSPNGLSQAIYGGKKPKSLSGVLLGLAAFLLIIDVLMSLYASGRMNLPVRRQARVLGWVVGLIILIPTDSFAQTKKYPDALDLHLAYIVTGDSNIDAMSKSGLEGLKFELNRRTTIEPVGVRAINIETDPIDFYPFLYWPVLRSEKPLSDAASRKINAYMASGGTLVFDTQDYDRQKLLGNQTHPGLETLSKSLDIPRLAPPPTTHVITKSFYLIQTFPGRWAGGGIWLEQDQRGSARDGVSSVIVGSNDWAAAWAKDDQGRTLAVIEDDMPRQREYAYRFGVNLAMYALAGNYKADQVHAATLIERLGQAENPPSTIKDLLKENELREENFVRPEQ